VDADSSQTTTPDEQPSPPNATRAWSTELVSTGMSGLDAQFGGGIPQGALYLVTSSPTTATSTFLAQYAAAGLEEGETVYYFSLEHPGKEVTAQIKKFLKNKDQLQNLQLIDGYPRQFRDVPPEARQRLDIPEGEDLLGALEHLLVDPALKSPVRIIVESLSELLEQYPHERVFRAMRVLRAVSRRLPGTGVVTMVSDLHEKRTNALAKHLSDGVVEFHVERKGFGIYPYIAITKMRGVTGSARLLLFKETEQGLWLESTKRVY
jgi:KaiC/GvpD/RAD55 family RecA-like ATPase